MIRTFFVAVLAACLLWPSPASAEPPWKSTESGSVDMGWVRVDCTTRDEKARCQVRYTKRVRSAHVEYSIADFWGSDEFMDYRAPRTPYAFEIEGRRQVVPGVTVVCDWAASDARCALTFRGLEKFSVSTFVAGRYQGGMNIWA